ncbi:hypothetical protein FOZ60_014045 [Perkinsus olseni]|uniref:Uncharacterized protein n=1 Tax=Perkinsus olseni TaxID=32597 RepID=A0A7J6N8N3_PEROL|nr:hypothetical protein FOZ60_014045 [Perkinsus olseni]
MSNSPVKNHPGPGLELLTFMLSPSQVRTNDGRESSFLIAIVASITRSYDLPEFSGQVQYRLQESCGQDCVTAWNDMMLPKLKRFQAKEAGHNGPNVRLRAAAGPRAVLGRT